MSPTDTKLQQPPLEAAATLKALADVFLRSVLAPPGAIGGERPAISEQRPPAVVMVDADDRVYGFDSAAEQLWGMSPSEVVGTPLSTLLDPPPPSKTPDDSQTATLRRADGGRVSVVVSRHSVPPPDSPGSVIVIRTLPDSPLERPAELRYRNLVEQIPAVVFTAALEGGLSDLYVGPQIEALLGYTQEEWLRSPVLWYQRLHPEDRAVLNREFARGCATGGPFKAQCRFIGKDGRVVWVHGEARLIRGSRGTPLLLQGVAFDITESKRAEEVVRAALREKELLLKEIHHRVKNNLQITSSLLRLQIPGITDDHARAALQESQDRIRSMALVHEMLYRSPDLSRIDFADYVRTLVLQLFRSYNVDPERIKYELDIHDAIVSIDVAVPCGLLVNELVANSLHHAFPKGRVGKVRISLITEPGRYRLSVADDGIGLPPDIDQRPTGGGQTLGLQLVQLLTEQINGRLELKRDGGTAFSISFPGPEST
jgi:PAS domain S-box-containing protein